MRRYIIRTVFGAAGVNVLPPLPVLPLYLSYRFPAPASFGVLTFLRPYQLYNFTILNRFYHFSSPVGFPFCHPHQLAALPVLTFYHFAPLPVLAFTIFTILARLAVLPL